MRIIPFLLVLLVACAAPSEEPTKPSLPDSSDRVVQVQDTNAGEEPEEDRGLSPAEQSLNETLSERPPLEFTLEAVTRTTRNGTTVVERTTEYVTETRLRVTANRSTPQGSFVIDSFFLPDDYVECVDQQGWRCYDIPERRAPEEPEQEPPETETSLSALPDRTVAGLVASCFESETTVERGVVVEEFCYGEGIMLYHSVEGPELSFERRVTSFERGVNPGAYELPAEPEELPDNNN